MNALRRRILAGLATFAVATPSRFRDAWADPAPTGATRQPEVVVIGAGPAGIAAGLELTRRRIPHLILEARDRIGGRTWTEADSLGLPFDQGAAWVHTFNRNPLRPLLRKAGVRTWSSARDDGMLYANGQPDEAALVQFAAAEKRFVAAAQAALETGRDRSLADLVAGDDWLRTFSDIIVTGDLGADADDVSVADLVAVEDGDDRLVEGGLGAFIERMGRSLPVKLGHAVRRVDWSGGEVLLEGDFGSLRTPRCLVTVPTNLMVDGSVTFSPELPADMGEAFSGLPLGLLTKIAFRLSKPLPNLPEFAVPLDISGSGRAAVVHLSKQAPLATVLVGGSTARSLVADGDDAVHAFGEDALTDVLGSDIRTSITRRTRTRWEMDPYAKGSYTIARPGQANARTVYKRSLADRVYFAGEASGGHGMSSTVGGAWMSGLQAAIRIASTLETDAGRTR